MAATFQALGPLFMVLLALPGVLPSRGKLLAVAAGAVGVAMVVLRGGASLDVIGVLAALGAALAVALGGTLVHKWGRPLSIISLTAWQMIIAGVELAIVAALLGDMPETLTGTNILGLAITALPFMLWFTGIQGVVIVIGSLLYGQHVDRKAFRIAHHHAPSAKQAAAGKAR